MELQTVCTGSLVKALTDLRVDDVHSLKKLKPKF